MRRWRQRAMARMIMPLLGFLSLSTATTLAATIREQTPASACTFAPFNYYLLANRPFLSASTVVDYGEVSFATFNNDVPCGVTLEVLAKRKACGFFGCNYEVDGSAGPNTVNSNPYGLSAFQPCYSGTNRYLTVSNLTVPGIPPGSDTNYSDGIEFTCK